MRPGQHYSIVIAFVLVAIIAACNSPESKSGEVPKASQPLVFVKMIGTWQGEDGRSFERWTKKDDGNFQSVAFSVKGSDTSWNEQARIYPENDKWIFENTVKGQNEGKAVKFTSSLLNENSVQFSNPAHDFPTDVNYTIVDANTVHAFIIGPNEKGGKDTIHFNYKRFQ